MKHVLLLFFLLGLAASGTSQELTSRVLYGGYVFTLDNQIYSLNEMIRDQPKGTELRRLLRSGRRNRLWGGSLGFAGAFLIGTALADALSDDDGDESLNHWQTYVAAGVLVGVSFPLISTADKRIEQAVGLYNSGPALGKIPERDPIFYAGGTREGMGIGVRF
ncbi:hypothetical protein [Lewinella sp. IMCC34191]|uniref:hypothetical protein n=1 Tax=Lewinella sp. IMCC34191 TaxID=2259172 RepID=UPI001300919A|nr:hypothetical protein [Lewinella sp. IMCC34191]